MPGKYRKPHVVSFERSVGVVRVVCFLGPQKIIKLIIRKIVALWMKKLLDIRTVESEVQLSLVKRVIGGIWRFPIGVAEYYAGTAFALGSYRG